MELGDVKPLLESIPVTSNRSIWLLVVMSTGHIIEALNRDDAGAHALDHDINVPRNVVGTIGGNGGRKPRLAGQFDASDWSGRGRAAIIEVQALLVAGDIECGDFNIHPQIRVRRRDLVNRKARLHHIIKMTAVLDLRGSASGQVTSR